MHTSNIPESRVLSQYAAFQLVENIRIVVDTRFGDLLGPVHRSVHTKSCGEDAHGLPLDLEETFSGANRESERFDCKPDHMQRSPLTCGWYIL